MIISSPEILAITGVISIVVGIISLIISYFYNKATLKQSRENLLIQLYHKDKNDALFDLLGRMTKNERYNDINNSTKDLLNSYMGQFIPNDVKDFLGKELLELEDFLEKSPCPKDKPSSDKEVEEYSKIEEEREKTLDPIEKFEEEFAEKVALFKKRMIEKIYSNLKIPEVNYKRKV